MTGSQYATTVYPVTRRFIGLAKEASPGTAVAPTFTFPMQTFKPVDKYTYLEDVAWRNSMAGLYNLIQGVRESELSLGGPFFADGIGYLLTNILGDYTVSMTNGGTSTTVLAASSGGTAVTLISGTLATSTPYLFFNTGSSGFAEVIQATSGSGVGPYILNRALYYTHGSGATITASSGTSLYTHTFSLLNSGAGPGGYLQAQPPTYTLTDYTGPPATTGARQYTATCLSELALSGTSTALVEWDAKATGWASAIDGQTPTASVSSVIPQAAWRSTVSLASGQVFNNIEWKTTISRQLSPKFTNSNQQDPYVIPRGMLTAGISLQFDPAQDESEFLYYLNNTQPILQIVATNGLSSTSSATITINAQVAAFDTGEINDQREVFGFDETVKCVANTTNAGVSGGYSPVSISLQNAVPSY